MAQWGVVGRVLAYDAFVKNNESVAKVQRFECVGRHDAVSKWKTINSVVDRYSIVFE